MAAPLLEVSRYPTKSIPDTGRFLNSWLKAAAKELAPTMTAWLPDRKDLINRK